MPRALGIFVLPIDAMVDQYAYRTQDEAEGRWGGNSTREVQKTRQVNLRIQGLKKNSVSILEKILPSVR